MRQVNSTDLSDEQEDILLDAPLNDVVLITGPPGSGKTVMAFHRGEYLSRKHEVVNLMMYNKVLKKFSDNATEDVKIRVSTMHAWMWNWWRALTNKKIPELEPWQPDWNLMLDTLLQKKLDDDLDFDKLDWRHLIIDEAQDFSPSRMTFLNQIRSVFFQSDSSPSLTLLADENQRIGDDNSTIEQIKSSFSIDNSKNCFKLTKNYRNTDEINTFIEFFYVGLESGKTKPSGKKGDKPELVITDNFTRIIEHISRYSKMYQNHEIGIIVPTNRERSKYYDALSEVLNENFNVQTYSSGSKVYTAETLQFDREGTITVLNRASCKGLEFDAVFLPELSRMPIDDANLDTFKMNMYVMCSRARTHLTLFVDDKNSPVLNHLPSSNLDILEYKYV